MLDYQSSHIDIFMSSEVINYLLMCACYPMGKTISFVLKSQDPIMICLWQLKVIYQIIILLCLEWILREIKNHIDP